MHHQENLPGVKNDQGKHRWHLMPWVPLQQVVWVLEHGASKYSAFNWQQVDNPKERYTNAAMRHLIAYMQGETRDPESKLHHLAHAATNCLFVIWFDPK